MKLNLHWVSGLKDEFLLTSSCLVSFIIKKILKNLGKLKKFKVLKLHEENFAPGFGSESSAF